MLSFLPRPFLFATLGLLLVAPLASAQKSEPSSGSTVQHRISTITTDHEQIIAYWTTETGWKSELQLRNNLVGQDLTVTPTLRLPDGAETTLSAVTIKPQEVKSIDLDAAISAAAAPQLVATYGSIVLRYHSLAYRNLYAVGMVHSIGHSIAFHIDGIGESQEYQAGAREGMWWLPTDTANDYLIVTNQGQASVAATVSLFDASGRESKLKVLFGPRETKRYSVRKLLQTAQLTDSYGGIQISTPSHAGSLDTLHFIYDEKDSFSAILKMFDHDPSSKLEERDFAKTGVWTLRAPMLALSNPDPALAFPPGTRLRPQLFVRNTTAKPVDAALHFNWRSAGGTGKAAGPSLHLSPNETRRVDVAALQSNGLFPREANWASVTLTTNTSPDEVVAVATSYDQTLKYGAQTPFSDQLSFQWEGSMWEYDAQHNSIMTAGNGGTKPTQAAFTIFYDHGTQKYELEQILQPDEQMWVDIGKLIREHVPDKNGKTLPRDLTSGSYEIRDLDDTGVGSLFEGKIIYDKTYGHVTYGCGACCAFGLDGYDYVYALYSPLVMALGASAQNYVYGDNVCTGNQDDVSPRFYRWVSGNTSIATTTNQGNFTGKGVGSTTGSTSGSLDASTNRYTCVPKNFSTSGTVTVTADPDHLVVVVDNQGYPQSCPTTGIYVRQMQMRVVDANGNTVSNSPSVAESFPQTTSSCDGKSPSAFPCLPTDSNSMFIDTMAVSGTPDDPNSFCNTGISHSSSCGFSVTSTWSACATSGSNSLWVSPRVVHANGITVDGKSTNSNWPAGTNCTTAGCH